MCPGLQGGRAARRGDLRVPCPQSTLPKAPGESHTCMPTLREAPATQSCQVAGRAPQPQPRDAGLKQHSLCPGPGGVGLARGSLWPPPMHSSDLDHGL